MYMNLDINMEFHVHVRVKSVHNCWSNISIPILIQTLIAKMGKADITLISATSSYIIFWLYEYRKRSSFVKWPYTK